MEPDRQQPQPGTVNFPAYLRRYIGKRIGIDFLIGTGTMVHRTGVLKDVGPDHVVITNPNGTTTIADLFSIKFVDILD